jgi:hypothetical protein
MTPSTQPSLRLFSALTTEGRTRLSALTQPNAAQESLASSLENEEDNLNLSRWPALCAALLWILLPPAATAGTINRSAEGEFLSAGEKAADFATMGYFGHVCCGGSFTHRIYCQFDLTSVATPIASATLRLEFDRYFANVSSLNFTIYDFGGNPDDLLQSYSSGSASGVSIFNDLGSGTILDTGIAQASQFAYACSPTCSGAIGGPGTILDLALNQAALNALNAALRGKIGFGIRLDDESASDLCQDFKAVTFRYPFSGPARVAELNVEPVPEPSTFVLTGLTLPPAVMLRRRSRLRP